MNNVIILKLTTSEEVIGVLEKETANGIMLSKVLTIRGVFDPEGVTNYLLFDYCFSSRDDRIMFRMDDIMHIFRKPKRFILKHYEQFYESTQEYSDDSEPKFEPEKESKFSEEKLKRMKAAQQLKLLNDVANTGWKN